jgi:hypothetical protein
MILTGLKYDPTSLFGRDTELQLRNEDFIQKNRAFLTNEILMQGDMGKNGI